MTGSRRRSRCGQVLAPGLEAVDKERGAGEVRDIVVAYGWFSKTRKFPTTQQNYAGSFLLRGEVSVGEWRAWWTTSVCVRRGRGALRVMS